MRRHSKSVSLGIESEYNPLQKKVLLGLPPATAGAPATAILLEMSSQALELLICFILITSPSNQYILTKSRRYGAELGETLRYTPGEEIECLHKELTYVNVTIGRKYFCRWIIT